MPRETIKVLLKVLLIEDNPDDAFLIQETLAESGTAEFQCEVAGRLSTGLERLARERIDVVLSDLSLPDSRGGDTVKSIRQQFPGVPVVLLTGLADEKLAVEAVKVGAQDYLLKGKVDSDSLARSIRYAIERHRLLMETDNERQRNAVLSEELQFSINELRQTQQQVLQQERLRALGQMASGVAHDFNNSLSPIVGYSDLLLMNPEFLIDQEKALEYLQRIKTGAETAGGVVNRLREFYRPREDTEEFSPVDLNGLIEETITLSRPRWQAQAQAQDCPIKISTDLGVVPLACGDESQLRDVLMNLIFNAVDAMPEGGTLTLRTPWDGGHLVLRVEDTGIGMSDEVRRKCLEPWFTTKGDQGTGLGLALVYGTIQRHRGTVDIQSKIGEGTTIAIRLLADGGAPTVTRTPSFQASGRSLHVLVVDDESEARQVIADYLTVDGHKVEMAVDGREGLAKFLEGQFDLAVVDLAMPDLSGSQLAVIFKQVAPHVPVISLSGFGDLLERPKGADLNLNKPVTWVELSQALAQVEMAPKEEFIQVQV